MKIQNFTVKRANTGNARDATAIDTHLRMPNENSDKHEKKTEATKNYNDEM